MRCVWALPLVLFTRLAAASEAPDTVDVEALLGTSPPPSILDVEACPPYSIVDMEAFWFNGTKVVLQGADSTRYWVRSSLVMNRGSHGIYSDWDEYSHLRLPLQHAWVVEARRDVRLKSGEWVPLIPKWRRSYGYGTAEERAISSTLERLAREALVGVDLEAARAIRDSVSSPTDAARILGESLTEDQVRALQVLWAVENMRGQRGRVVDKN